MKQYDTVVIGTSAGGLGALTAILAVLPENFKLPILVVQHQPADADDFLHRHLNDLCQLNVKEASPGELIVAGKVYIAPRGYHLLVEESRRFSLSVDLPVNYAIPSIDVLFESAADVYKAKLIGVILTGANNDGALGLKEVKAQGGLTIVQAPETAEVSCMPQAAIGMTKIDHILSLNEIASFLTKLNDVKDTDND